MTNVLDMLKLPVKLSDKTVRMARSTRCIVVKTLS